jgi:hypothetical protein
MEVGGQGNDPAALPPERYPVQEGGWVLGPG